MTAVLKLAHLVHEGLQSGAGMSLLLAVVGQVEEGNVIVVLPEPLNRELTTVPGIQVNGMMFTRPEAPL